MNIDDLRIIWIGVLNRLEHNNRMAWIAYFDARLARIEGNTLFLDFSDVRKFSGALEFSAIRESHRKALESAIFEVAGSELHVEELA